MRALLLVRGALSLCLSLIPLSIASASAADLTGTWQGIGSLEGEDTAIELTFSPAGYLLFNYEDNRGNVRGVELNEVGQIRFSHPEASRQCASWRWINAQAGFLMPLKQASSARAADCWISNTSLKTTNSN